MRLTRRGIFGLVGGAAAAKAVPAVGELPPLPPVAPAPIPAAVVPQVIAVSGCATPIVLADAEKKR